MLPPNRDARAADILRHFPKLLERWQGGYARLWSYTVSHASLTIRIERPGITGNLHICCSPRMICAPVAWNNASVAISYEKDDGFLITDVAAGVRIIADAVELKENVTPIHCGFEIHPSDLRPTP